MGGAVRFQCLVAPEELRGNETWRLLRRNRLLLGLNVAGVDFCVLFLNVSLLDAGSHAGCSRFLGLFKISVFNHGLFLSSCCQCVY